MNILNIHQRHIKVPPSVIAELLKTLASKGDKIWPYKLWPKMKLDRGLSEGSKGGHGPIRYFVKRYTEGELIEFQFQKPKGLEGLHRFEILPDEDITIVRHTIQAKANGITALLWLGIIRPLHDALIEDAFDKIENHTTDRSIKTPWTVWVKLLRKYYQ